MLPAAATGIVEHHARWDIAAPSSIIAGKRPEIASFGFTPAWVQHWCGGFIHEELGGALQIRCQAIDHRGQMEGRLADPRGQGRAIQIDALATVNLSLPIEMR